MRGTHPHGNGVLPPELKAQIGDQRFGPGARGRRSAARHESFHQSALSL